MEFKTSHVEWLEGHLARRKGERRGRLERGHAHAERLFVKNVWWRVKGNFEGLHPEYEVLDWRGRPYFADFVYQPGGIKVLIEVKGYVTHARELDRRGFDQEFNRETFLTGIGYTVISFSYDDVNERPDLCITLLRMVLSRFEPHSGPTERQAIGEREILRLAVANLEGIRPVDVTRHLRINRRTAVKMLNHLCRKGQLVPIRSGSRILRYRLVEGKFIGHL